jgi:hypothetical protein
MYSYAESAAAPRVKWYPPQLLQQDSSEGCEGCVWMRRAYHNLHGICKQQSSTHQRSQPDHHLRFEPKLVSDVRIYSAQHHRDAPKTYLSESPSKNVQYRPSKVGRYIRLYQNIMPASRNSGRPVEVVTKLSSCQEGDKRIHHHTLPHATF